MRPFEVIPAIDIRNGRCVRLYQGKANEETVFGEDPVLMASRWEEEGAGLLHVVDLDGAFSGAPRNMEVIARIAKEVSIPVQVGGGIRSSAIAMEYIEQGIERVIVGTAAFRDREWTARLAVELGDRLIVGLDTVDSRVAVNGWTRTGDDSAVEAAAWLEDAGVRRIVYTDVSKDGTLRGPDISGLEEILNSSSLKIIASGGIGSVDDLLSVSALVSMGVEGVITGMALYRDKFTLAEAIEAVEGETG